MKTLLKAAAVVLGISLFAGEAHAQLPFSNTQTPPTTSPYLNLLNRQGALPNYQTLVRPQLEARQQFAQQQREINRLQQGQRGLQTGPSRRGVSTDIRGTGHTTQFMYFSHFFPSMPQQNR